MNIKDKIIQTGSRLYVAKKILVLEDAQELAKQTKEKLIKEIEWCQTDISKGLGMITKGQIDKIFKEVWDIE